MKIVSLTLNRPLLAAALVALFAATAQGQGPVLKPSEVTEGALVDALAPAPAPAGDTPTTRSIRPSMKPTAPAATAAAAPGKANLLITFATGSSELSPETMRTLEVVAKALQSERLNGMTFRVEGHADPRGSAEYNLKLSADRAAAVVAYLSGKLGVPPERLSPVGKGSTEPLDAARPDAPENRRVTFVTTR
jgi:OOP family OmpA-OmpF porin